MENISKNLKESWEKIGIPAEEIEQFDNYQKRVLFKSRLNDSERDIEYQLNNLKNQ